MKEDQTWRELLAQSRPAFAGETEVPYGLATRVLAGAREQRGQRDAFERIGWRAILASLAMVALTAGLTLGVQAMNDREDLEPGIQSLAVLENVQVS